MLTGKQKRYLRALGSEMDPIVQVGKSGIIDEVVTSVSDAVKARELIKVRVLKNSPLEPQEAMEELAGVVGCELVQVIGRNGLLYKKNPDKTKIELPE